MLLSRFLTQIRRTPNMIWAGALLYPLMFLALNLSWFPRAPEGTVHIGFLQNDQHLYTAYAREVFENGNGLIYGNPYAATADTPRHLTNLGYLALAWLHRALPVGWVSAWELVRLFGAIAMLVTLYHLVANLIDGRRRRIFFWGLAMTAGGISWLAALRYIDSGWLTAFIHVEDGPGRLPGFGWWLMSLFRQGLYPLETIYHALLYAALTAFILGRIPLMLGLLAALWWTHPITAALATTTLGLAGLAEWIATRDHRRQVARLAGIALVSLPFAFYYQVFIPSTPSGASLVEQTLGFAHPLHPYPALLAWSPWWLAVPAVFILPAARRFVLGDPRGRLILAFFVATAAWLLNDWWLPRPVQPMHFSRGHMLLALILMLAVAARAIQTRGCGAGRRVCLKGLAATVLLISAADSLFFVARLSTERPYPGLLTVSTDVLGVLDQIDQIEGEQTFIVFDAEDPHQVHRALATLLPARTRHRVLVGDMALTPFYEEKIRQAAALASLGDPTAIERYGVNGMIVPREQFERGFVAGAQAYFRPLDRKTRYVVLTAEAEPNP